MDDTMLWQDSFGGAELNAQRWVGGHYNTSAECKIHVDNGLHIAFDEGVEYASAGVLTREPIVGDFEASLRFKVENPALGTTFELAAITVDPPRSSALDQHQADSYTRSRVYDVHGVPPFVSSEFDEADGWRISWNRSSAQAKQGADGEMTADNHFNRYGRNHGNKPVGPAEGWLRLVRQGDQWRSFGKASTADATWFPTGDVVQMNLSGPVFLRLAAKHWVKRRDGRDRAPSNKVHLHNFELRSLT